MNLIPEYEWKTLNYELFDNKPDTSPFPQNITKRRELLLVAQSLLSSYEHAKAPKLKVFFSKLYKATMNLYFKWENCLPTT